MSKQSAVSQTTLARNKLILLHPNIKRLLQLTILPRTGTPHKMTHKPSVPEASPAGSFFIGDTNIGKKNFYPPPNS